jgi:NAD(P)-dependent dehydrogenase (short-subunit alcohol dehydrogenase family)
MNEHGFAFVTGGGSGIGRATAIALARKGLDVVVADSSLESAVETAKAVRAFGYEATALEIDVTDLVSIEQAIAVGTRTHGNLVAAVNSAGIQGEIADVTDCSPENWSRIIDVNLTGAFFSMQAEIGEMLRHGEPAAVVNISSNFGIVGQRGMPAYCASKHGLIGLSKSAALDYADRGVRVNVVSPGPIATPLLESFTGTSGSGLLDSIKSSVPMRRIGSAEEVAEAVVWLLSENASYVTGAVLSVDGGYVVQ